MPPIREPNPGWQGVYPAVTTQFHDDQSLNFPGTAKHVEALLRAGVHGLIMLGSVGENVALEYPEKLEVLRSMVRQVAGRVPVLTGVAECTTSLACRFAVDARKAGVDGLMVLPAMVYKADPREAMAHFRAVARASDLPILVYNNPVSYGVDITPAMFADLADEPRFVAIKESSENIRRITDLKNLCGDVRDGVMRKWLRAAPEVHQHPPVVIDRYLHAGDRHPGHSIRPQPQHYRRAIDKRVGHRQEQRRAVAPVKLDHRHVGPDDAVGVRVHVEVCGRVRRVLEQRVRRLIRLRLDHLHHLAGSSAHDSVAKRPGRPNVVEEAKRLMLLMPLEKVALKFVPEHGLALRFHRVSKGLVVARPQHLANRFRGEPKVRELFDLFLSGRRRPCRAR